ncbi:MAG TPA: restriction endonuclease subunit S, partial [Anaerolineaceae bacterium]|nr:restriction endonuclease subunit S [Anaerolineaceae bacterium]
PLPTQRKIAAILSAYDDLIENNTRRIRILEAMAQAIYREWFVNFRYPGHEGVRLVESPLGPIPEGWEVKKLGDLVGCIRKSTEPGPHLEELRYIPIDLIPRKSLSIIESLPGDQAKSSLLMFDENDVLFGAMRPYFHKVSIAPFNGVTRSTCFVLRPIEPCYLAYSLMTLFQTSTIEFATNHSQGGTIPYVVWDNSMSEMPVINPPISVINPFEQILHPIIWTFKRHYFRQNNLRQQRDLLLPRLISGELDVEALEIPTL